MKYQNLFSGKNKKNITDLSSAELAKRVVKVKVLIITSAHDALVFFYFIYLFIFFCRENEVDISCELSAFQTVHKKYHIFFSEN